MRVSKMMRLCKGLNSSEPGEIAFRPVEESDFTTLTAWLAEPHVRRFYQKTPVTLEQVALEYGPFVRGEEPTICHLAVSEGTPFAYLQCYRNADLQRVAFRYYAGEMGTYIAHEPSNTTALRCSRAVGFRRLCTFLEDGIEMVLLWL